MLDSIIGIARLAKLDGVVLGFAAGFADAAQYYKYMWKKKWGVLRAMSFWLLGRPWLVAAVFVNFIWTGLGQHEGAETVNLASTAVLPGAAGSGLGRMLLDDWISAAELAGARFAS